MNAGSDAWKQADWEDGAVGVREAASREALSPRGARVLPPQNRRSREGATAGNTGLRVDLRLPPAGPSRDLGPLLTPVTGRWRQHFPQMGLPAWVLGGAARL